MTYTIYTIREEKYDFYWSIHRTNLSKEDCKKAMEKVKNFKHRTCTYYVVDEAHKEQFFADMQKRIDKVELRAAQRDAEIRRKFEISKQIRKDHYSFLDFAAFLNNGKNY